MIAIMIAAEISYGAIIILPTVSATNKTIAPINKLIDIKCLCSVPTNKLEIWGTSKPIKPIPPTTATLILHNKTANNDKPKRYTFTFTPSEVRVRSSNPNRLHAFAINKVMIITGTK